MISTHKGVTFHAPVVSSRGHDIELNFILAHCEVTYNISLNSYNQALKIDDHHSLEHKTLIYYDRAFAHLQLEDFSEAIANLTHILILHPKDEQAYYQRGYAYQKAGNYQAAFQDFTEAIKLNPQLTTAYINRGISAAILGFQEVAWQNFKIALTQFQEQNNQIGYQQTLKLMRQFKQVTSNTYQPSIG